MVDGGRRISIGVVGGGTCSPEGAKMAEAVGRLIAERGALLITGGLSGVMEAASRGAKSAGGLTVGILPGTDRADANPYVDIPIVTGLNKARNVLVVMSSMAVIAVEGSYGTLSEVAIALNLNVPVITLNSWSEIPGVVRASDPDDAVERALQLIKGSPSV